MDKIIDVHADKSRKRDIDKRIREIKKTLSKTGPMRPGSLSRQYHKPAEKKQGFWQLNYMRRMKSRSESVRDEHVDTVRLELDAYKNFKALMDEWIELAIERSRLNMNLGPIPDRSNPKRIRAK